MTDVLVKRGGQNSKCYHKPSKSDPRQPRCCVTENTDSDKWESWGIEKAEVWRRECKNAECYGEPAKVHERAKNSSWPA